MAERTEAIFVSCSPLIQGQDGFGKYNNATPIKQQDWLVKLPLWMFSARWHLWAMRFSSCPMKRVCAALAVAFAASVAANARGLVVFAGGAWAVIDPAALGGCLAGRAEFAGHGGG